MIFFCNINYIHIVLKGINSLKRDVIEITNNTINTKHFLEFREFDLTFYAMLNGAIGFGLAIFLWLFISWNIFRTKRD